MDLLLPTWLRLERDRAAGIAIVPMSPAAPWWTIMKGGLISKMQIFAGTSLTIPDGCVKINTHDKLTNLEFAIVKFYSGNRLNPHKNSPTRTPLSPQATSARLTPAMPSNSAIEKTAGRSSFAKQLVIRAFKTHFSSYTANCERLTLLNTVL